MMNLQYEINSVLTRTGYKMTNKRKLLIKLISNRNSEFISARIIHKEAKLKIPGISLDTVYRTLFLLEKKGFIEKKGMWERECKYQLVSENTRSMIKCLNCGKSESLDKDNCPIDFSKVSFNNQYKLQRFEFYGYCYDCLEK